MERKIIKNFIACVILIFTIIFLVLVYKTAVKIEYPWYFESLRIIENQNASKNKTIGIAIIDSGFNSNVKEYFNNEVICYDATGDKNVEDVTGHGTQIALLIASNSKRKRSIYGINSHVQLYSIRATNSLGLTNTQYLHNALQYCKELNVEIINISLGGTTYNELISEDIDYLKSQGKFVVCSSGDTNSSILYPANYDSSYCIVAQNEDSSIYEKANVFSPNKKIFLKAPGVNIDVLVFGDDGKKYITKRSGSSYATAIFSGYLSLVLSIESGALSVSELDSLLSDDLYCDGFLSLF